MDAYSIIGVDINLEYVSQIYNISPTKIKWIKEYLGLKDGMVYKNLWINNFKAQEILDRLGICVIINEYDWFYNEYQTKE